jgi:hypothetical protein
MMIMSRMMRMRIGPKGHDGSSGGGGGPVLRMEGLVVPSHTSNDKTEQH